MILRWNEGELARMTDCRDRIYAQPQRFTSKTSTVLRNFELVVHVEVNLHIVSDSSEVGSDRMEREVSWPGYKVGFHRRRCIKGLNREHISTISHMVEKRSEH